MSILTTVLVTFFAGMGAGLGTGFAGMSAAAVFANRAQPKTLNRARAWCSWCWALPCWAFRCLRENAPL